MGLSLPSNLPIPRRFVILGISAFVLVIFLHTFAPSALPPALNRNAPVLDDEDDDGYFGHSKWIPPIFQPENTPIRPPEFDADGQCLFLSPYDALSPAEKARAEAMELEEISPGVVRLKMGAGARIDELLEDESGADWNATMGGMSHPILGLLRMGEKKWNEKLASQSRTLEEAAEKYKAKWGRNPPKGFNLWWQFGQSRNILLPDEFDSIMNSLLPFYGLPVEKLQERLKETESLVETFTLIVHDGKVELQWNDDYARDTWIASRNRADKQINLMENFISMLGSFRATYTIHDQPTILLDHERREQLLTAARKNTVSSIPNDDDRHESNWHGACGKDDPINRAGYEELPATDTFIDRHTAAMDICKHPSYLENHGMLLETKDAETHPQPHTKLFPILVPSKTMLNADIPITPVGNDNGMDGVGADPDWNKKSSKMYWRGLATGLNHNKKSGAKWRQSHRERLHFLANDRKNLNQMILSPVGTTGEAEYAQYPLRELGEYYMDAKMAGGHWQCDWDDGTCSEMDQEIDWAAMDNAERSNEFKYVFDTDGNAWSSRFPRLMASNNVVIKASVFPEWNTQSLPEWYAYVPSKMDYSDLFSILAFFRGSPSGKGGHDEVARRIAVNSQCWVEKTWRKEDMQTYMFLLYLEYARLTSPDRDTGKMDFHFNSKHTSKPVVPPAAEVDHTPAPPPSNDELKEKLDESTKPMIQEVEDDGSLIPVDDSAPLPAVKAAEKEKEKEKEGHQVPDAMKDDFIE